jgi:hypothetical protein
MPIDAVRRFVSSKTAIVDMLQDRLSESRAEVERLKRERDAACMAAGEYSQDEVNAMTTEMIAIRKGYEKNAYRRGAEAMREACAQVDPYQLHRSNASFARSVDSPASVVRIMQEAIRALPIPGEP